MKLALILLLTSSVSIAQSLSPQEQRALLNEVQDLKRRVEQLERSQGKSSSGGFRTTDYQHKSVETSGTSVPSKTPAMTEEQRKEIMETVERYKKAQAEQEKALKELEDEE